MRVEINYKTHSQSVRDYAGFAGNETRERALEDGGPRLEQSGQGDLPDRMALEKRWKDERGQTMQVAVKGKCVPVRERGGAKTLGQEWEWGEGSGVVRSLGSQGECA